jgi:alpha-tubulin suppressor-like RCC1 family protein
MSQDVYAWGFLGDRELSIPQRMDVGSREVTALLPGGFTFGAALSRESHVHVFGGIGVVKEGSGLTGALSESTSELVSCGAAGYDHVVVACGDSGHLYGWGANTNGQAVPELEEKEGEILTPKRVSFGHPVKQIACGARHTLVLTADAGVFAFGDNSNGQLGCATESHRNGIVHVKLNTGHTVTSIAAGALHSLLALSDDSGVYAFGWNLYGQCGTGDNLDVRTAALIPGLCGIAVRGIAGGLSHSACVTQSGDAYVWGRIDGASIQHGGQDDAGSPAVTPQLCESPDLDGCVRAIRCGARHIAALRHDGSVVCWGWNGHGQTNALTVPAVDIQCGWWHTLALITRSGEPPATASAAPC